MLIGGEALILERARVAGRVYCDFTHPAREWTDKAGTVHTIEPATCGGRLKPIRRDGAYVEGILRCNRCGRDTTIPAAPTRPERDDTQDPEIPGSQPTAPGTNHVHREVGIDSATSPHQDA